MLARRNGLGRGLRLKRLLLLQLLLLELELLLVLPGSLKGIFGDADPQRVVAILQVVVVFFLDGDASEIVAHVITHSLAHAFEHSVGHSIGHSITRRLHQLLELGPTILKPDFHLRMRKKKRESK